MNKNELLVALLSKWNSAAVHAAAYGCCQRMFNPQTLGKCRAETEPVSSVDGCELKKTAAECGDGGETRERTHTLETL